MNYSNVTNIKWANAEHTVIDCVVDFDEHGPSPFGAVASGDLAHTHEIFERCVAGDFGPIAEYVPPLPPTQEQLAARIRDRRNELLQQSDWTQLPDVPQATKDLWSTYRQALRDITLQSGFPTNVEWPVAP